MLWRYFLTVSESDLPSLSISVGRGREDHCVFLSNGERTVRTARCYASADRRTRAGDRSGPHCRKEPRLGKAQGCSSASLRGRLPRADRTGLGCTKRRNSSGAHFSSETEASVQEHGKVL